MSSRVISRVWVLVIGLLCVNLAWAQDYFTLSDLALIEFDPISREPIWPLKDAAVIPGFQEGIYRVSPVSSTQTVDTIKIDSNGSFYQISHCGGVWNVWPFVYEDNTYILCVTLQQWPRLGFIAGVVHFFWSERAEEVSNLVLWRDGPVYAYYVAELQADGNFALRPISRRNLQNIIPDSQYNDLMEKYTNLLSITPQLASDMWEQMMAIARKGKQYTFTIE